MDDPDLDTLNLNDLMMFDASNDRIEPTDLLDMGQSELIGRIADRWGASIDEVLLNIKMRAQLKGIIAEAVRTRLTGGGRYGGAGVWIWVRCMANGAGGMRGFYPGMCKSTLYSS